MDVGVVVVGVGGQGVLTLARWLGEAAMARGLDVRIAEIHGLSQRGGSVEVHVRLGDRLYAPTVSPGEADVVVALEALEALRGLRYLRDGGKLVVNRRIIQPPGRLYSLEEVLAKLAGPRTYIVPAFDIAMKLGSPIYENAVMLGFLTALLDLPAPPGLDERNMKALAQGQALLLRG